MMNSLVIAVLAAVGFLALLVAFIARQRGKSALLWLVLSLVLTPFLSFWALIRSTRPKATQDESHMWVEFESTHPASDLKCSACRIPIRTYTRVCFHCGSEREPSILTDGPHRNWCDGVVETPTPVTKPESVVPNAG
jgi:hypothetical protein